MKTMIVILTAIGIAMLCNFIAKSQEAVYDVAQEIDDAGVIHNHFVRIHNDAGIPLMVCVERAGYSDCERPVHTYTYTGN